MCISRLIYCFTYLLFSFMTLAAFQVNASTDYVNLLINPGFEKGFKNGMGMDWSDSHWGDWNTEPGFSESNDSLSGGSSQAIDASGYQTGAVRFQQSNLKVFRGHRYEASFYMKWSEIGSIDVIVRLYEAGTNQVIDSLTCSVSNSWPSIPCKLEIDAISQSQETIDTYLAVILKNSGTLLIDDVTLNNVDKARFTDTDQVWLDSVNGDDSAELNSQATPWKTLAKLREYDLLPNTTVNLKRGSQWRVHTKDVDELSGVYINENSANPLPMYSGVTYQAYGDGDAPLFIGSINLNESDWINKGNNIWESNNYFGYATGSYHVGYPNFIMFGEDDQDNVGTRENSISDLDSAREFYIDYSGIDNVDKTKISIYSTTAPNVEVAFAHAAIEISNKNNITVNGLAVKHARIYNFLIHDSEYINISNLESHFAGANLNKPIGSANPAKHGAGFYIKDHSNNIVLTDSHITQCLDQGVGIETSGDTAFHMYDITIENNTVELCGGGIGVKAQDANNSLIENVFIRYNTILNVGYGWSGINNAAYGKGITLLETAPVHGVAPSINVNVENNIIDTFAFAGIVVWRSEFTINGNIIRNGQAEHSRPIAIKPAGIVISGNSIPSSNEEPFKATGLIANNVIYNNQGHEIFIKRNNPQASDGSLEVYNNVFLEHDVMDSNAAIFVSESANFQFKNNIVVAAHGLYLENNNPKDITNVDVSHNLFYRDTAETTTWIWDGKTDTDLDAFVLTSTEVSNDHSVDNDPLFTDALTGNFICTDCGYGADLDLAGDFYGNPYPAVEPDLGAFQGVSVSSITTNVANKTEDGYIKESAKDSGVGSYRKKTGAGSGAIRVGDTGARSGDGKRYVGVVSFETSDIPINATIQAARLKLTKGSELGNPDGFGKIFVDLSTDGFTGNTNLESEDYESGGGECNLGRISIDNDDIDYVLLPHDCITVIQNAFDNATSGSRLQFRLAYPAITDHYLLNNDVDDYRGYWSSEKKDTSMQPTLIIDYVD